MDLRVRLRCPNPAGKRLPQKNRVMPKVNALLFRNFPGGIGSCFRRPQENDQVSDLPCPLSVTPAVGKIQLLDRTGGSLSFLNPLNDRDHTSGRA